MAAHDNQFHPENVDKDIDQLLQIHDQTEAAAQTRARFIHEVSNLYLDESQVLDRAWKRLSPHVQSAEHATATEEPVSMQQYQTRRRNRHMIDQTLPGSSHNKKGNLKRLTVIGSGLVAALLIASILIAFTIYHQNQTTNVSQHPSQSQTTTHKTRTTNSVTPLPQEAGPAASYILSAALASHINTSNQPIVATSTFKPGQVFWLTFTVQPAPNTSGKVTAKWYQNNSLMLQQKTLTIQYSKARTSNFAMSMRFAQPTSGKVEIYWNNQLARTFYFTVKQ